MQKPQENTDLLNLDKIIFEKIDKINELTEEIAKKDSELEILDEDIQEFRRKIKKKNNEITNLDQLVRQKDKDLDVLTNTLNSKNYELIETRNELTQIHNSIIFKFSKNISNIIDFVFPNNSKRGEFKKVVISSILLIQEKGLKEYLLAVKAKIRKKEFKLNTIYSSDSSLSMSENDKIVLMKKMQDNRKNRLKIRSSSKLELQNDGFIISDDNELN